MMKTTLKKNVAKRGFTLIELLVVIVILSVLAALIVPNLIRRGETAKVTAAVTDLSTLTNLLEQFRLDMGRYPSTEEGIFALTDMPADDENWQGPYTLNDIPLDPWGSEYIYEYFEGEDQYELLSLGADSAEGGEGNDEDIYGSGG